MAEDKTTLEFPDEMGRVAIRALKESGIENPVEASKFSEKELLKIHGVGPKAIRILRQLFEKLDKY